jgi:hypothetical protein
MKFLKFEITKYDYVGMAHKLGQKERKFILQSKTFLFGKPS